MIKNLAILRTRWGMPSLRLSHRSIYGRYSRSRNILLPASFRKSFFSPIPIDFYRGARDFTSARADHYATLGVSRNADEKQIKAAYLKLALKHHPDRNPDKQAEASKKFKEISQAYSVLSDPEQKRRYDMFGTGAGRGHPFGGGGDHFRGGHPFGGSSYFDEKQAEELFKHMFGHSYQSMRDFHKQQGSAQFRQSFGSTRIRFDNMEEALKREGFGSSTTETITTINAKGQRVTRSVTETQMPDGTVARTVHEEVHAGPFSMADHKLRLQRKHAERMVKSALKSTMKQMGKEMLKAVGNSVFHSIKGAARNVLGSLFGSKKK